MAVPRSPGRTATAAAHRPDPCRRDSRIRREIDIDGPLSEQDRQRLVEIADRGPVHRTLSSEIVFETTET
jgi:uncharacterized OsmC-like protein